jgi:hypothetical protein
MSSLSFAQGYYPLQVGNQWDYGEIDFHTPSQFVYLYSEHIVGDTTMPNGLTYAIKQGGFGTEFLRQSGFRVYSFASNKDTLAYDFTVHDGDTVCIVQKDTFFTLVTVHLGQGEVFGRMLKGWSYITTTNTSSDGGSRLNIVDSIGRNYLFMDPGYSEYLMGAIIDGKRYGTVMEVPARNPVQPSEFQLFQNYPNPFNPVTTVEYYVPIRTEVDLTLYSALGQKVREVAHGMQDAGPHIAHVEGTNLPSGTYFLRLVAPNVSITKTVVLIK